MKNVKEMTASLRNRVDHMLEARDASGERDFDARYDIQRIDTLFMILLTLAVLAAGWVGLQAKAIGPVMLWVFASLASGATAGFLFGIPKSGSLTRIETSPAPAGTTSGPMRAGAAAAPSHEDAPSRARPNTNLEEISDWLTKILIGLTLVNLAELKEELGRISTNAAAAIRANPTAADVSTAMAMIIGFALVGFLAAYIYMRLFVQGAMVRSDDQMRLDQYLRAVARAEKIGREQPETTPGAADAVIPSSASLSAAQDVAKAAPSNRPELILEPLRQLASEYEALRQSTEYSGSRTQEMAKIVQRMRPHAIAAAPYIDELIKSSSPGEHLAATVILQMKYLNEHMEWLARRLVEERAFIGYQAASALLARLRVAGPPEARAIQDAVRRAKQDRAELGIAESSLDRLIDKILETQ